MAKTEYQHNKLIMNNEVINDTMRHRQIRGDAWDEMVNSGHFKKKKPNIKEHCPKWKENTLRENVINNGLKLKSRRKKTEAAVSILNLEMLEVNAYILSICL